jgi:hypothetical protein
MFKFKLLALSGAMLALAASASTALAYPINEGSPDSKVLVMDDAMLATMAAHGTLATMKADGISVQVR